MQMEVNLTARLVIEHQQEGIFWPKPLNLQSTSGQLLCETLALVPVGHQLELDCVILRREDGRVHLFTPCGVIFIDEDSVELIGTDSDVIRIEPIQET